MSEDINEVMLVGRLTRDAELQYTNSGYALCKFSVAVNRRKKEGDQWVDEANFFESSLWGKRGESLNSYLTKGTQVAIEGQLKQDRWEKDGVKRSKVSIEVSNIQLLGGKSQGQPQNGHNQNGSIAKPQQSQSFESYTPPSGPSKDDYEDDIPF